jgi:hypothetical protein
MKCTFPRKEVRIKLGMVHYASTTAIYSHVGDEYRNRLVMGALAKRGITFTKETFTKEQQ